MFFDRSRGALTKMVYGVSNKEQYVQAYGGDLVVSVDGGVWCINIENSTCVLYRLPV